MFLPDVFRACYDDAKPCSSSSVPYKNTSHIYISKSLHITGVKFQENICTNKIRWCIHMHLEICIFRKSSRMAHSF